MKKYRITKRVVMSAIGVNMEPIVLVFEPQEVSWYHDVTRDVKYEITSANAKKREINPSALIEANCDWLEEVKPERWRAEKLRVFYKFIFRDLGDIG